MKIVEVTRGLAVPRAPTHFVIKRIFFDRKKWGKDDLKDEYLLRGKSVSWGHRESAAVFSYLELFGRRGDTVLPICGGCDVVIRQVRIVIAKEGRTP